MHAFSISIFSPQGDIYPTSPDYETAEPTFSPPAFAPPPLPPAIIMDPTYEEVDKRPASATELGKMAAQTKIHNLYLLFICFFLSSTCLGYAFIQSSNTLYVLLDHGPWSMFYHSHFHFYIEAHCYD